jgi:hydroxymethylpyrimidine/phosphomethylpyrimidine kinase
VLDPVMVASSGDRLLDANAVSTLCEELLPVVDLVTPNLAEAAVLLGEEEAATEEEATEEEATEEEAFAQLERLQALIPGLLITGGHLRGNESVDLLAIEGSVTRLRSPRVQTRNTHGTGCTLSAAIAALRPQRADWASAVSDAKDYVTGALLAADALEVGGGRGPLHHFHEVWS